MLPAGRPGRALPGHAPGTAASNGRPLLPRDARTVPRKRAVARDARAPDAGPAPPRRDLIARHGGRRDAGVRRPVPAVARGDAGGLGIRVARAVTRSRSSLHLRGLVGRAPAHPMESADSVGAPREALKPAAPPVRARSRIYAMRSLTCSSSPWLRPPMPRNMLRISGAGH